MAGNGFSIADYAVFSVTILISLGIGIYYALSGGKQKTTSEYLVGNRQMKILPVALSLMVSFESSIMMLGFPAETYVYGIMFWLSNFGFLVANLIGIRIVVPLVHPLRLTSVYEYFEMRYKSRAVRLLGTALGGLGTIFYMGIVLFGPGIALEAVTSFPLWASVLLVALASVIYTSIGGIKAVIWTDVFQSLIMFMGVFAILIKGSMVAGGISNVFHINAQNERLNFFDFNPDPTVRHTFWSLIFGSCIRMVTLTFNQTSVQRISAMNKQSEANKVLLLAGPAFFVTLSLATLEGLVAFAYFYTIRCDPLASKEIRNPNQVVPYMVLDMFKDLPGMPGIFMAALFSASLSMEDGFITFVKTISAPAATKMEEEKITSDLVCHMSDEELSNYLPHHGERIRLRTYLKKDLEPQKKKSKLLTILKQKLTDVSQDSDNITGAEMRNPHRPFGNRNASKQFRLIELGWIHKTGQRSTQVRKNKGGGTRKMEVPKMATKTKIMEEAISLFFPNGISAKGPISKFNFDLWDFSDRPIDMDTTVAEMYDKTKMPLLRFYLSTSQKDHVELEQITNPGSDESPPIKDQPTPATGTSKELDDLGQKQKKGHEDNTDIISQAMEIAGLPALDVDEDDFLPDPIFHPTQQSSSVPLSIKEHMLKLHRGHLLRELIVAFKDIDPMNDIINIQMVMPDGTYESAEDGGGVTRDALSDFWTSFYDQCTIGTKFKIPFLRHDFAEKEWESVAKIMAFGWKCCGYFPVKMSLPFLQICLYGTVSASILDSFFEIIPEDESATLKKCLADFESVEMDDLIDILQMYNSKTLPKADNIVGLLKEIAHKEIIQTPMFIVDCFQPVLKNLHIAEDQLRKLYTDLIPTPKLVNKMLQFPDTMCSDEQTVSNHLRRFIRELNNETLRKFVRFCTGSDLMVNKEINVNFVNVSGLARRPVAHTCSCLLELSKTYESFPQFRSEFLAVLETNVWVMDII